MTWVRAVPRLVASLAERHVVLFVVASIVFWTLLSPLALVWLVLSGIDRYVVLDKSPDARRARRVARLLRWYPPQWRARYGDEMGALLHDMILDGRGGPRLHWNLAREGTAARLTPPARRELVAAACLWSCWLPLIPQGVVAAGLKTFGAPTRSWFLALHLPEAAQWPVIAAMVALGVTMLVAGLALTRTPTARQPG